MLLKSERERGRGKGCRVSVRESVCLFVSVMTAACKVVLRHHSTVLWCDVMWCDAIRCSPPQIVTLFIRCNGRVWSFQCNTIQSHSCSSSNGDRKEAKHSSWLLLTPYGLLLVRVYFWCTVNGVQNSPYHMQAHYTMSYKTLSLIERRQSLWQNENWTAFDWTK